MELYLNNALKKKEPHDLKFLQQIYGPRYKPRKLCHIRCNKCFCNGPSCDCCKIHDFREEEKDYDCGCQDNAITTIASDGGQRLDDLNTALEAAEAKITTSASDNLNPFVGYS